jgi:hypothetical protein
METLILMPLLKQYNITDLSKKIQDYVEMDNYLYDEDEYKYFYGRIKKLRSNRHNFKVCLGYPLNISLKPYKINFDTFIRPEDDFLDKIINEILYKIMFINSGEFKYSKTKFYKKGYKYGLKIIFSGFKILNGGDYAHNVIIKVFENKEIEPEIRWKL